MLEDKAVKLIYAYIKCQNGDFIFSGFIKELVRRKLVYNFGIWLGDNIKIGKGLVLPHPQGIVIGNNVRIGNNVTIYQQVTLGRKNGKYPKIRSGCVIYPGAKIVGGVTVGHKSIIGANSVVLHSTTGGGVCWSASCKNRNAD